MSYSSGDDLTDAIREAMVNGRNIREAVMEWWEKKSGKPLDRELFNFAWDLQCRVEREGYYEEVEELTLDELYQMVESYEESTNYARVSDVEASILIDQWSYSNPKLFLAFKDLGILWRAAHALTAMRIKLAEDSIAHGVNKEIAYDEVKSYLMPEPTPRINTLPYDVEPECLPEELAGILPSEGYMEKDPSFLPKNDD